MAKIITLRPGPVIPYEIIELIIALIADEKDDDTLHSLSLLNYHFSWVARRYIFSCIDLDTIVHHGIRQGRSAKHFVGILQRTPKIASFVRKFNYVNDLQNKRQAPAVLKRLYNVSSFTLGCDDGDEFSPKQAKWSSDISPALRRGIFSFFRANSITSLQIRHVIEVPGTIFNFLPCLEELDLHVVTFVDAVHDSPSALGDLLLVSSKPNVVSVPARLKVLTMRRKMEVGFAYLIGAKDGSGRNLIDCSHVTTAQFHIDHPDMTSTFLAFLSQTERLERITFGGYCSEFNIKDKFTSSLNPSSFETLRFLDFWYMVDRRHYDPFGGLVSELSDLAYKTRGVTIVPLEEVSVSVQIDTDGACDTSPQVWSKLDVVLSEKGSFPCLRKVCVNVTIHYIRESIAERLLQELDLVEQASFNGLKKLQRESGLYFNFKVTKECV